MDTQSQSVTLLALPDSIDGLLSVLQDLYVRAGNAALDIDGYMTFLDASYLGTALDELADLGMVAKLAQAGLIASRFAQEGQS
jgi:hypothetical protein